MQIYRRLCFRLPAEHEEELVAELWALGTLGVETAADPERPDLLRADAWFAADAAPDLPAARGSAWRRLGAELVGADDLPERDWLAEYRRRAPPLALGRGFWADPGDPEPLSARGSTPPGRRLLRLPARRAFGTGSHPSTRLAVELLEEEPPRGLDLLDVGAGSGVLGLVALHLGARRVVAVEIDPVAALQAGQIALLNGQHQLLVAGTTAALGPRVFDRLTINMTLGSMAGAFGDLARLLRPGGQAVISGILATQRRRLRRLLDDAGWVTAGTHREAEWIAVKARPAAG